MKSSPCPPRTHLQFSFVVLYVEPGRKHCAACPARPFTAGSAAARQAQPAPGSRAPDVTLISSSDDEDGGGTIGAGPGPAAAQARVHAAAGAALGLAGPTSMTATTQQPGATGSTQGGSGTQAGGRKRPASFFGVGAGVGAGAAGTQRGAGRGRGQPR